MNEWVTETALRQLQDKIDIQSIQTIFHRHQKACVCDLKQGLVIGGIMLKKMKDVRKLFHAVSKDDDENLSSKHKRVNHKT